VEKYKSPGSDQIPAETDSSRRWNTGVCDPQTH
jgi:hypothetical protein